MDTLVRDLRHAARTLARMRGVAVVAGLTLAVGIGATTTMVGVAYAALLRPVPFPDSDRLMVLYVTRSTRREGLVRLRWSRRAIGILDDALAESAAQTSSPARPFDVVASFTPASVSIRGAGEAEQIDGEIVSPEYFHALRVSPIAGRTFHADEDGAAGAHPLVVVGEALWRRRFDADPALVGRSIRINDVPLTVVGILPGGFAGLSGKADLWMPRTMAPSLTYSDYLTTPQHFINVVARVSADRATTRVRARDRANAELAAIGPRLADVDSAPDAKWSAIAVPIAEARIDATSRRSVLMLLTAAACVLLSASINVAGLLLARARVRRREMAVRIAIGSSRVRLVRQLLTEAALLAAAGGAFGTLLAKGGVEVFARYSPAAIASMRNDYGAFSPFASPALDFRVLLLALAITIATTLLCGLAPALQSSRTDLVTALKEDERGGGRHRLLAGLVVCEVALAVALLAATGLLVESVARMQELRAGFVADRVLTFWVRPPNSRYAPADGPAIVERLLTRIEQVRGVESAAVNRCTPFTGCARTTIFFPDRPVDRVNAPVVGRHYVSPDYFRTLAIPLISGRALTAADRAGRPPVTVINETAARRFWPGENPLGRRVWFGSSTGFTDPSRPVEVVGIVGDVKYEGVLTSGASVSAVQPDFYTSYLQFAYPDTMMMVKAKGPTSALVPALRAAVASVDPAVPIFDVQTLDERIGGALARPRFNAAVLGLFAAVALLLSAIGVYGMLSYAVSSRMREIGVRVALGADARRVLTLVLGQGLRLAGAGAAVGVTGALVAARLLQGWLPGAADADARLMLGVVVVMMSVAGAAAFLPARRASAVDPIAVLRQD